MQYVATMQALRDATHWALHRPPKAYAGSYTAIILLFWIAYLCLPLGSFSQSTLRQEGGPLQSAQQGLVDLTLGALRTGHSADENESIYLGEGWSIPIRHLSVRAVDVTETTVSLNVTGSLLQANTPAEATIYAPNAFDTWLRVDTRPVVFPVEGLPPLFVFGVERLEPVLFSPEVVDAPDLLVADLLPAPLLELKVDGNLTSELGEGTLNAVPTSVFSEALGFAGDDAATFQRHHSALYLGDPSAADGKGLRLLYYSTTTVTTLGLGDIVPVSDLARGLTIAQTILGLLLAGLFLNALAEKYRSSGDA